MSSLAHLFLQPSNPNHRRYEALRAMHVEGLSAEEAARRFDYHKGSVRNLAAQFRKNPAIDFFRTSKPGRKPQPAAPLHIRRTERILALRKQENLSAGEIQQRLAQENIPAGISTIARTIKQAGLPRLWRRTREMREEHHARRAPAADVRRLDLTPRRFRTRFGGLFLFAFDLARLPIDPLLEAGGMPGSQRLPAGCAFRALLALKLWGIGRPHHVMPDILDEGPALFAGLNVMPKRSTLSEYSCRVDPRRLPPLMDQWHHGIMALDARLGRGTSFDLDFHTIPYHGDRALVEKHYVSKRSRRQRGILAFVARDAAGRTFAYAHAQVRKEGPMDEILHFVDGWQKRTGRRPAELVFDSRLTTYANLAKLHQWDIRFLTLRRRTAKLLETLMDLPAESWRTIRLSNVGRAYRTPRVFEEMIQLKGYPEKLRQIAITQLGHEKPTLLITNDMKTSAAKLIDRYARRMIIENNLADAIDFFHMDALSAAVPMKIDVDLQLTLMASALYRMLAHRVGGLYAKSKARTLFREFVAASATVTLSEEQVTVRLGRRARNGALLKAGYLDMTEPIPWLQNRRLRIDFV